MAQLITITDLAKQRLIELSKNEPDKFLKVSLKKGGCAGMEYGFSFVDEVSQGDEEIMVDNIKIVVDRAAILFLVGARMDYKCEVFSQKFVFDNPNVIDACGCGESVKFKDN